MDKVLRLRYVRCIIIGLAGISALLAGCSSGNGKTGGAQPSAATTTTATRTVSPTTTTTVPSATTTATRATSATTATTASKAPATTPPVQSSPSSGITEIKVTMANNKFPEEIHVKAGSKVIFVVTNESSNDKHSFEFPDFGLTYDVQAGETVRIEWQVPSRKGTWDAGCFLTQPGGIHDGMEGHLIIE